MKKLILCVFTLSFVINLYSQMTAEMVLAYDKQLPTYVKIYYEKNVQLNNWLTTFGTLGVQNDRDFITNPVASYGFRVNISENWFTEIYVGRVYTPTKLYPNSGILIGTNFYNYKVNLGYNTRHLFLSLKLYIHD